ncbi:hypothetical protein OCB07_15895 [Bacillus cereus]|nr:hypothetical protein [Bacillus cereus]
MIKVYDSEYERDFVEIEPLEGYVWIETGSDMHESKNYGVGITYKDVESLRDYLTQLLEGRKNND